MIKQTISIALLMLCVITHAQTSDFIWPVKGKKAGENILYAPQSYIDKELNFGELFISTNLTDTIVSPIEGEVKIIGYHYLQSLYYSFGFKNPINNFTQDCKAIADKGKGEFKKNFININIGIKGNNGLMVYISGLEAITPFKTGTKIKKGQIIGLARYSYHKIPSSSIMVSVSRHSMSADPMTPFGIKTTFKKPTKLVEKTILSPNEMTTDLNIFTEALIEGFPGLYDYITKQEFDSIIDKTRKAIEKPLKPLDFEKLIQNIISSIHDFHLCLLSPPLDKIKIPTYTTDIRFGWFNDTLMVRNTLPKDSLLINKQIVEIDGVPADSLRQNIKKYIPSSYKNTDGFVKSYSDYLGIAYFDWFYFYKNKLANKNYKLTIKLADGTTHKFGGYFYKDRDKTKMYYNKSNFFYINDTDSANFTTKLLPNKTAFVGVGTFQLNEVELDSITNFVQLAIDSSYQNLIIDVRNNYGGEIEAINRLYGLIAQEPFSQTTYNRVNKKGDFEFFKHCENYGPESGILFQEYNKQTDKEGYYLYSDSLLKPNVNTNFKGKVYVLTNEISFSAATVFPAMVHKYKRGAIVGRETRGAYHQLKAEKFANIRLTNSRIMVRIPLIQIVFDTTKTSNIPLGRGVLPDFPVEFSIREIASVNGDSILNYAQHLIATNQYIKANIVPTEIKSNNYYVYVLALIAAVLMTIFAIYKRIKK